jgi:hypothetical protein
MKLKTLILAGSLALSGCATPGAKLSPEQIHQLFVDFRDAGCKGSAGFDIGAGTGQLGGEAHATARASGDCDPANAPHPTPAVSVGPGVGGPVLSPVPPSS